MSHRYPRIGSDRALNQPAPCAACDENATRRIDVQTSWFRGEDDVFLLCHGHLAMAEGGKWRELYRAIDDKKKRPVLNPDKVACPECGRRVKTAGLADHRRDMHSEMSLEQLLSEKTGIPSGCQVVMSEYDHDR